LKAARNLNNVGAGFMPARIGRKTDNYRASRDSGSDKRCPYIVKIVI
jgi:hypothetical protein